MCVSAYSELRGHEVDAADVIKGDSTNNKAALEALVHKHGGDFTQAQLSDNTAMVIAPDEKGRATTAIDRIAAKILDPRCRAQVRKGLSLVKPEWIYESIKRKRKLPLLKSYVP